MQPQLLSGIDVPLGQREGATQRLLCGMLRGRGGGNGGGQGVVG